MIALSLKRNALGGSITSTAHQEGGKCRSLGLKERSEKGRSGKSEKEPKVKEKKTKTTEGEERVTEPALTHLWERKPCRRPMLRKCFGRTGGKPTGTKGRWSGDLAFEKRDGIEV